MGVSIMGYQVIIPAAGEGKRMKAGKNKQFITLQTIPIIIHTLKVFEQDPLCADIFLVINKAEEEDFKKLIMEHKIKKIKKLVPGGSERQESVYCGLMAIEESEIVLVHDGARPFVQTQVIHTLFEAAKKYGAATVAVPVKDTIKQVSNEKMVMNTIDRSSLWSIQTPQAFHMELLKQAHDEAREQEFLGTDDASLVERLGKNVYIVDGDYKNIKLTTPEDLIFAEAILSDWTN